MHAFATPMNFDYLLQRFIIYAFLGWILESGYKTIGQRRGFINSGFLSGPIIPIYGFGAVIMEVLISRFGFLPLPLLVLAFTAICTAFEYAVGLLYEGLFGIRLWDYSKKRLNLHGRICLKNTLLWALLVTAFILFIQPAVDSLIATWLSGPWMRYAAYGIAAIALGDAARSTLELKSTADFLARFRERISLHDAASFGAALRAADNRFFSQFPNLRAMAGEAGKRLLAEDLMEKGSEHHNAEISRILKSDQLDEASMDGEYLEAVRDLLDSAWVREMARFPHHDASVLEHCVAVSRVSFVLARRYGLDAVSAARGALLHDFFLYDWRREKVRNHAFGHARTALSNARKHFELNEIEADCILSHMWPLSRNICRFRESFIVSLSDKLVTTRELGNMDFRELARSLAEKHFGKGPKG